MGFRFRRSIKLIPGVRLNLSPGGISTSFGVRGLRTTVGKSGTRTTVGIPGTGLSYSVQHGRKKKRKTELDPDSENVEPNALAVSVPAAQNEQRIWFVHINDEARGPFNVDVLRQAMAHGTVSQQDWVWREGLTGWIQASDEPTLEPSPIAAVERSSSRSSVSKAFLLTLVVTLAAVGLNYKDILDGWSSLPYAEFAAQMCGRILGLPIIIAMFVAIWNFFHRNK